jgi:hypothetical protein
MKKATAFLLIFSLNAAAAEVTKFEPRPAVVEQEGESYVGILLSEEDFRELLQKKIDSNAKIATCEIDQRVCTHIQNSYKTHIQQLEDRLKKNNSWFDRNRGSIGVVTGLLLGTTLSVGIVQAVYQK